MTTKVGHILNRRAMADLDRTPLASDASSHPAKLTITPSGCSYGLNSTPGGIVTTLSSKQMVVPARQEGLMSPLPERTLL